MQVCEAVHAGDVIDSVSITIYHADQVDATVNQTVGVTEELSGELVHWGKRAQDPFFEMVFSRPASAIVPVAQMDRVISAGYQQPVDEPEG